MIRSLPAITLLSCLAATSAVADATDDRIHELEHLFVNAMVLNGPEVVDCTLSGGAQSTCFTITVKAEPQDYEPGPWCPTSGSDGPELAGKWFVDGEFVDADGAFMASLADVYDDPKWQMVDPETGEIKVTDSLEQCAAAARPDVGAEYENFCVVCEASYMDEDAAVTYTIPLEPVAQDNPMPTNQTGSGVAFNGIRLDGPAPVDAILGAYTVAPFDDCGGHVNLHVGYHYHAATDCLETTAQDDGGDAPVIGIAMDGYDIRANLGVQDPTLDECNGHDQGDGYHYHAGEEGANLILGCMTAQAGCVAEDAGAKCDASARPPRP
ncbi:YHYH protein [Octadecabacter sp. CECT 8868]|uniref:YHYH protein n=1 Tax=Octadecabacter algicola TaxID=2909342 RepID=UPI001F39C85A|nr:YHYH protein [Octadecabacter algicola]MCF2906270.1 YHYH protein [Octadecabacter algicola]